MQSEPGFSTPEEAAAVLVEVEGVARSTRRHLQSDGWQWLSIWAVVCLGAGVSGFVDWLAPWYWAVAVPVGIGATVLVSTRIDARKGVRRSAWPYWTVAASIAVLNFGGQLVLTDEVLVVWVWVVFGLGFAGFAWIERQTAPMGLMVGLAGLAAVLGWAVEDTFALYPVLGFLFAAALGGVVAGLYARDRGTSLR